MSAIRAWAIVIVIVLVVVLSSCSELAKLLGLGGGSGTSPDLKVTSVEPLWSNGAPFGVRLALANVGSTDAEPAEYAVVLSSDTTISLAADVAIYRSTVDLAAGEERRIDLSFATHTSAYMQANGVVPPSSGRYFLGASIDSNGRIGESDESNNELASATTMWFIDGVPAAYTASGNVNAPAGLTTVDEIGNPVSLPDGSYKVYVGFVPVAYSPTTLAVTPDEAFHPGWTALAIAYHAAWAAQPGPYIVGTPSGGSIYLFAFLDADGNGAFDMAADGSPREPSIWFPVDAQHNPASLDVAADIAALDLTLLPAPNMP